VQTYFLHGRIDYQIKRARISPSSPIALKRWDALARFEKAISKGLSTQDAAQIVGVSRASLYRWKARKTENLETLVPMSRKPKCFRKSQVPNKLRTQIVQLRREFPTWGKRKVTTLLRRQGVRTNESAVGRTISKLIKRKLITSAKEAAQQAGRRPKPTRPYAVRLKRGQRLVGTEPGEVVQIDHMSVAVNSQLMVKHFNAVCTFSRWNVAEAYRSATALRASVFIDKLIKNCPFPIKQIQVDGGSEFMAEFEETCRQQGIGLAVLAPRSPKLNGHVERINGTWRADFYNQYDLPQNLKELNPMIDDFTDTYNWDRPHESLALQTPQEFLEESGIQIRASQSHML